MSEGIIIEMADHPQAILDALALKRAEIIRSKRNARILNWGLFFLIILTLLIAAAVYFFTESVIGACITAALPLIVIVFLFGRVNAGPGAAKQQLEDIYSLLHVLRDDTGRRGWVVGTLDLSGARQKSKLVRSGRSGGGKPKAYYRDPWFRANMKLADGNQLQITIADKVKVKAGAEVGRVTVAKTKLKVNPAVYRIETLPTGEADVIVNEFALSREDVGIRGMLMGLKSTYMQLRPIGPKAVTGMAR